MKSKVKKIVIISLVLILGFGGGYLFKHYSFEEKDKYEDLINDKEKEIESLNEKYEDAQKEREKLQDLNDEKQNELNKSFEELKEIKEKNMELRKIIGYEEIRGKGIEIVINPFETLEKDDEITHKELIYLVNELKFAGAEGISINDRRITVQTGIESSSNNEYILINDKKISPVEPITIKVIGNKENLIAALEFSGTLEYESLKNYNVKFTPKEDIKTLGVEDYIKTDYIK